MELEIEWNRPVILIDWDTIQNDRENSSSPSSDSVTFSLNINSTQQHDLVYEPSICNNVLIFYPPEDQLNLILNQLKINYNLNRIVILVFEGEDVDTFLYETANENLFILSSNEVISHWRVTDNQIRRVNINNFVPGRPNLHSKFLNRHLHIATIDYPPVTMITPMAGAPADGIEPQLLALIAQHLNFTFDYNRSRPDQMWDGLYKLLTDKVVDVSLGDMFMHASLKDHYAFSIVYKINYEGFLVPIPRSYAKWTALVYPFPVVVWIASFISVLAAILVLYLLSKWAIKQNNHLSNCACYVIGNLLAVSQSSHHWVNSNSQRLFLITWLLMATILSTAYKSSFISRMTWPGTPPPIDTIQQLADSSLGKTSFLDWRKEFLLKSTDPHRQRLGSQWFKSANVSEMMSLLDTNQWAVESSFDHLLYLVSSIPSGHQRFRLMKETLKEERSCMYLQKESALKPYFDRSIQFLIETGFYDHLRSKFCKKIGHINTKEQQQVAPFSLDHLQGAFYVFAIGMSVSLIAFLLELLVSLIDRNSSRRK